MVLWILFLRQDMTHAVGEGVVVVGTGEARRGPLGVGIRQRDGGRRGDRVLVVEERELRTGPDGGGVVRVDRRRVRPRDQTGDRRGDRRRQLVLGHELVHAADLVAAQPRGHLPDDQDDDDDDQKDDEEGVHAGAPTGRWLGLRPGRSPGREGDP